MTTRVVFAWELGTYLGHLERDLAVALRLRQVGADVRFVVANLQTAEKLLTPAGFPFVPSPALHRPARRPKTPINFSELLLDAGFDDAPALLGPVRAWLELWKLMKPDVIVTDFAPTALLSAKIAGIRTLPLGPGFTVPPALDPMPAFEKSRSSNEAALHAADQALLARINEVAGAFGSSPFETVASLFANPAAQITSFPELDPYGPREGVQYVGPIATSGRFQEVEWPVTAGKRVFVYLQSMIAGLETILGAMRQPAWDVICVIPGVKEALVKRYQDERLRIFSAPVELERLLPRADAVVGYGSAGLVSAALQAGAPLLLFPKFLEQQLNSACAARLGAAIIFPGVPTREKVKAALHALMSKDSYKQAASSFADRYRNYRHEPAIDAVAKEIAPELLQGRAQRIP